MLLKSKSINDSSAINYVVLLEGSDKCSLSAALPVKVSVSFALTASQSAFSTVYAAKSYKVGLSLKEQIKS